jgi:hypothetical protein
MPPKANIFSYSVILNPGQTKTTPQSEVVLELVN